MPHRRSCVVFVADPTQDPAFPPMKPSEGFRSRLDEAPPWSFGESPPGVDDGLEKPPPIVLERREVVARNDEFPRGEPAPGLDDESDRVDEVILGIRPNHDTAFARIFCERPCGLADDSGEIARERFEQGEAKPLVARGKEEKVAGRVPEPEVLMGDSTERPNVVCLSGLPARDDEEDVWHSLRDPNEGVVALCQVRSADEQADRGLLR